MKSHDSLGTFVSCLTSMGTKDSQHVGKTTEAAAWVRRGLPGRRGEKELRVACYNYDHDTDLPISCESWGELVSIHNSETAGAWWHLVQLMIINNHVYLAGYHGTC